MRSTLFLVLIALACGAAALVTTRARAAGEAGDETRARAAALLREAEEADASLAFARALARYEEGRALDPAGRHAPRAEARAAELRARAEGAFAPLAKLERVRRDPALAVDASAIDELVRDADAFPPGLVRVEAWWLAAEAYAHRLGRASSALPLYRRVATDAHADATLARRAARELATGLLAAGDHAGAREAATLGDAKLVADVARATRRRWLHLAALAALAALVVLAARAATRAGAAATARAARRALPLALAYATYVGVGGGALATGWSSGSGRPFFLFGAALAPILLLAGALGAAGGASRGARAARAAVSAASALGAALLVLEHVDVAYLEALGL